MSDYVMSRLILFAQAEVLATSAVVIGLLGLISTAASYFRHFATPDPVPIRLWAPIPDDLPDRPSHLRLMYGATDLKARYRKFMIEGVSGGVLLHAAAIVLLLMAAGMRVKSVAQGQVTIIQCPTFSDEPLHEATGPQGVSWGNRKTGPMPLPMPPTLSTPEPVQDDPRSMLRDFDLKDLGPGTPEVGGRGIWDAPFGSPTTGTPTPGKAVAPSIEDDDSIVQPVEKMPVLVSMDEPVYPSLARDQALEGGVTIRALVGPDGRVQAVRILNSIPLLDDAARTAALTAIFKPAYWNNKPVRVWVEFTIRFNLN